MIFKCLGDLLMLEISIHGFCLISGVLKFFRISRSMSNDVRKSTLKLRKKRAKSLISGIYGLKPVLWS